MTAYPGRLARARASIVDASLDALLVTHLPNVRYLCGFRGTAGVLLLSRSRSPILIVDSRYTAEARALPAAEGALIEIAAAEAPQDGTVANLVAESTASRVGIEAASMTVSRYTRLSAVVAGKADLLPTERMIERLRAIKDPAEIGTLREAARRISAVARIVPSLAAAGRTEREVAWAIDAELRAAGFERSAFETIVASGPNSALPHARPGDRRLGPGDPLVLDFGGVYDGYCVDLTRTYQLGAVEQDFRRMFAAVADARFAAIAAVRPGVKGSEIDAAARQVLARHGLADAFGHGTGHGLGLEVHEEPRIGRPAPGQPDEPVAAGMVFTIEPGAYVPGVGGVRLEDDVLVVDGGCEMLTDVPIDW